MISTSTTITTSAPVLVQVPTLSTPVSFPSSASALSPAGTDYQSPTSLIAPDPGVYKLDNYHECGEACRGVPPVTPVGLVATTSSVGGGEAEERAKEEGC